MFIFAEKIKKVIFRKRTLSEKKLLGTVLKKAEIMRLCK